MIKTLGSINSLAKKNRSVLTSIGVLVGASILLTGCSSLGEETTQNSESSKKAEAAPVPYGEVIGTGKKVKTDDGSYETVTLAKDSPHNKYEKAEGADQYFGDAGWTMKNVKESQKVAVDYMVKEFFDSTALENGDKGYSEWYKKDAEKYYETKLYKDISNPDSNVVLGNFAGDNSIPKLINDGKPRVKDIDLNVTGVTPFENEVSNGIEVIVEYSTNYRVADKDAIDFTSLVSNKSKAELIEGDYLNPNLLDDKGENLYKVTGYSSVILKNNKDDEMKIVSFEARTEYDTDALLKN